MNQGDENNAGQIRITRAHEDDPWAARFAPHYFRQPVDGLHVGRCSYCGSMTPERAIGLLRTPGTHFSGSDQKYGFPHKFYIGDGKFYSKHLKDADDATLKEFSNLSRACFGIVWMIGDTPDSIRFCQPQTREGYSYGWQRFGHIGADGKPVHEDGIDTAKVEKILGNDI